MWLQQLKSACEYADIVVGVIDTDMSIGCVIILCVIVDVTIQYTGDLVSVSSLE